MMTPTKFKPVILKNVCSKTYLDMFMHMIPSVELWENKNEYDVNYKKINLVKLNIVTHGKFDNPMLGGIAIGLLSQIYDAGGKDYITPEMHFCAVSQKDSSTPTNFHTDDWGEGKLKVLGILNSNWSGEKDGGGFICDGVPYKLEPTDFLIFIPVKADTICIHGDEPTGPAVAQAVRKMLDREGIAVKPLPELNFG